jgi:uncharacterized protein (DUF2132 family)
LSLTLWKGHKLKVFYNRVLKKTSWPKREEVTRGWRKMHNKELDNLFSRRNIRVIKSKRMRQAGHVADTGEKRNAYRSSVGKREDTT